VELEGNLVDSSINLNRDLRGVDLSGSDLREAVLPGANLTGADLSGADLNGATLLDVDFTQADLSGACLDGADLGGAVFVQTNLAGTQFQGATLRTAHFEHADLTGSNFRGADLDEVGMYFCSLEGADLSAAKLNGARFDEAQMSAVKLVKAHLIGAYVGSSNLTGADLSDADLSGAIVSHARLPGTTINRARLVGTYLRGANLIGSSIVGTDLEGADLRESDLSGADLTGARLVGAKLGTGKRMARLAGANLTGADLSGAALDETKLAEALLNRTTMPDGSVSPEVEEPSSSTAKSPVAVAQGTRPLKRKLSKAVALGAEFRNVVDGLRSDAQARLALVKYLPAALDPPEGLVAAMPELPKLLARKSGLLTSDSPVISGVAPFVRTAMDPTNRHNQLDASALRQLDHVWRPEVDDAIASYVESYGSLWLEMFESDWSSLIPDWTDALREVKDSEAIRYAGASSSWHNTLGMYVHDASLVRALQISNWSWPNLQSCDVCGVLHAYEDHEWWSMRQWLGLGICRRCIRRTRCYPGEYGEPLHTGSVDATLAALKRFQDVTGIVPTQKFRYLSTAGMSRDDRAMLAAALICVPHSDDLAERMGVGSWLEVLCVSGIAPSGWRPSYGTYCFADDGHACRSLGELAIDNFLTRNGIGHELEPAYPQHPLLNSSGRLRADWRLEDGRFVEYAGLQGMPTYDDKIRRKRLLAQENSIELVVLFPADLARLPSIIGMQGTVT